MIRLILKQMRELRANGDHSVIQRYWCTWGTRCRGDEFCKIILILLQVFLCIPVQMFANVFELLAHVMVAIFYTGIDVGNKVEIRDEYDTQMV